MTCQRFIFGDGTPAISIVCGPDAQYTIEVRGERIVFDWHGYMGPIPLGKRGNPVELRGHYFWTAVSYWAQQGKRIDSNGVCMWEEPKSDFNPDDWVRIGKRSYIEKSALEKNPKIQAIYDKMKAAEERPAREEGEG
jgi:hypothetical protein